MGSRLLIFGRFAHHAKAILTAFKWLTFVGIKEQFQFVLGGYIIWGTGAKLLVARSANTKHSCGGAANYQKFSFRHSQGPAQLERDGRMPVKINGTAM